MDAINKFYAIAFFLSHCSLNIMLLYAKSLKSIFSNRPPQLVCKLTISDQMIMANNRSHDLKWVNFYIQAEEVY